MTGTDPGGHTVVVGFGRNTGEQSPQVRDVGVQLGDFIGIPINVVHPPEATAHSAWPVVGVSASDDYVAGRSIDPSADLLPDLGYQGPIKTNQVAVYEDGLRVIISQHQHCGQQP